jgi:peptidyl-prolyl cis-trans isomerase D
MLQSIRERAQGAIAVIIVLFLCLTFAVWGVESYLNEARKVVVAEVNGDEIELSEYQETFQRLRQRAQAELGEAFDSAVWSQDSTKQKALDYLVEERVLTQNVDRARLRLSSDQVAEFLKTSPNFQVDGKFSSERYTQVTSALGFSEQAYEAQARKDLALQQLRTGVVASAFITPQELSRVEQLQGETRTIGYAVIAPTDSAKEVISEQEASAYFAAHQEDYRVEDKVSLEFVELKLEDLVPSVTVSDDELEQYYATHKADFTVEEQRNASHILVQLKADATSTEDAAAKQKALALRKAIIDGKPFAEVAKTQSDDIGSRAEGGATGLFGRGVMAPEFEQAVFSMQVDALSEPVKTSFGYHIIKLVEIKPGGVTPLAEVRSDVVTRRQKIFTTKRPSVSAIRFTNTLIHSPKPQNN